jgi:hypothetical protein
MTDAVKTMIPVPVLLVGLIGWYHVTRSPLFHLYRSVDVLELIAVGMCVGVALAAIIARFRRKSPA